MPPPPERPEGGVVGVHAMTRLVDILLANYSVLARPALDYATPTDVTIQIYLNELVNLVSHILCNCIVTLVTPLEIKR